MTDDLDLSAEQRQVMDGLKMHLERAAALGLLPPDGAKISARGQFIVNPTNVEEAEDRKMRGYRAKPFPRAVFGEDADGNPVEITVANREKLEEAIAAGWSVDPIFGPSGRLTGEAPSLDDGSKPSDETILGPGVKPAPKADKSKTKSK